MSNSAQTPPGESPGAWLTRQLERKDISVRRFADAMEVTTQTVYAWQNDRTVINEGRILRLSEVLGISEIETRRALGLWVPEQAGPLADSGNAQLRAELTQMERELAEMQDRIRRLINGS